MLRSRVAPASAFDRFSPSPPLASCTVRISVLGSAAGGGFPQWNCNCRNCAGVRSGAVRCKPRTQSSIFVRADDAPDGVLFNASPDILEQIRARPELQPARALRDTAIRSEERRVGKECRL